MSRDHVNVTVKEMNPHVYKSENTNNKQFAPFEDLT